MKNLGFTLIELLIVITIIGLLSVALLPQISSLLGMGNEATTRARMDMLRTMIEKYAKETGDFPPSDFAMREKGVKLKADSTNMGIECLLIHLHHVKLGASFSMDDKQDWLGNTDDDENGSEIPRLGTVEKLEVVDAWFNPIVYFRNDSYSTPQRVALHDEEGNGDIVKVSALKDDGGYLNKRKYQLISAGADGEFGTEDDICYPSTTPK